MSEEQKDPMDAVHAYWKGFPEAPASATFRWIDPDGFEYQCTVRGWSPEKLLKGIVGTKALIAEMGGKPVNNQPKDPPAIQIQEHIDGIPSVDPEGKPVMVNLPEGTAAYTVKGFYRGYNKDKTKDYLNVVVNERPHNGKYGIKVFHPPFNTWQNWPIFAGEGTPGLYNPPEDCKIAIIREGEKFPEVVAFRA